MKKSAIALAVGVALSGLLAARWQRRWPGRYSLGQQSWASSSTARPRLPCARRLALVRRQHAHRRRNRGRQLHGMALVYTNSLKGEVESWKYHRPGSARRLGMLAMGGEPTSVTVLGGHALVAVNTSANFVNASGKLVVDMAKRSIVTEIQLGGQPRPFGGARSKDGQYVAVVIENERDESLTRARCPRRPRATRPSSMHRGRPRQLEDPQGRIAGPGRALPRGRWNRGVRLHQRRQRGRGHAAREQPHRAGRFAHGSHPPLQCGRRHADPGGFNRRPAPQHN